MMWLELSNKLLTWEMLKKRGFEGPVFCCLCKMKEETKLHLFTLCPYVGSVWTSVTQNLSNNGARERSNARLEQHMQAWWQDEAICCYEAFPILFVYNIWDA